jgi:hypothetical protein
MWPGALYDAGSDETLRLLLQCMGKHIINRNVDYFALGIGFAGEQ